jgi:hypothetical protein
MKTWITIFAATILAGNLIAFAAFLWPVPDAGGTVVELAHDFGTAENLQGTLAHTFTLANHWHEPLIVDSVRQDCRCSVPRVAFSALAPGESGEVEVSLFIIGGQARHEGAVFVECLGRESGAPYRFVLKVSATVSRYHEVTVEPRSLWLGDLAEARFPIRREVVVREFLNGAPAADAAQTSVVLATRDGGAAPGARAVAVDAATVGVAADALGRHLRESRVTLELTRAAIEAGRLEGSARMVLTCGQSGSTAETPIAWYGTIGTW